MDLSGPIVKTVLESFDVYWNSHLATEPVPDPRPNAEAAKFVLPNERDVALIGKLRAAGESYRRSHKRSSATPHKKWWWNRPTS